MKIKETKKLIKGWQWTLPKSSREVRRWAKYFYKKDPAVRVFIDTMFKTLGYKVVPIRYLVTTLQPFYKALAYRDLVRRGLI